MTSSIPEWFAQKVEESAPEEIDALAQALACRAIEATMPPLTEVNLLLTAGCNLRCDYCWQHQKNPRQRMSLETARQAIDYLMIQSRNQPEVTVVWFGGEPLLEFGLMKQTADYARQRAAELGKCVSFVITTNGVLLDEERLIFAAEYGFKYPPEHRRRPSDHRSPPALC